MKVRKVLSLILALVLCLGLTALHTAAADAQDQFVAYAASLVGKSGPDLGFGNSNWCVRYINYCAKNNGGGDISGLFPDTGSVTASAQHFAGLERYYYFDDVYIPSGSDARKQGVGIEMNTAKIEKGDLAYFISSSSGGFEHIGIVESVNSNGVTIVHGSWSNRVARTNVVFGKTIGSNYPVRFAGIAKPAYERAVVTEEPTKAPDVSGPSTLLLLPAREPGENREIGKPFQFDGWAESNYDIVSTTIQVRLNDNMTVIMEKEIKPNKKKINVIEEGLNPLPFETLEEGQYNFWWLVKDASGMLKSWVAHFSVGNPTASTPTPTPAPTAASTPTSETSSKPTSTTTPEPEVTPSAKPSETVTPPPSEKPSEKPSEPSATPSAEPTQSDEQGTLPLPSTRSYVPDLFWDVKGDDWFYGNVADAYAMGLMNGTGAASFSPGNNMTLAEAVTLATRIHSLYHNGEERFSRYDGGSWYDPYVDYARENQIIDVNYDYTRPATREEFIHILAKSLPEKELENIAGTVSFADSRDIVYISDVRLLSGAGVINGIPENGQIYFKPNATITRAEVAAVVARMAQPSSRIGK